VLRFTILFLTFFTFANAKHCTFIPPAGWEIAQLKNPSPHVRIGFIGKGTGEFRPSMNLAEEEVDVSLKEYVKAVKELQLADPTTKWRDLGKFQMEGGIGRLTEMTSTSPWGEIKILQTLLVKENKAYILTAAVLKEDLPKLQSDLLKSFHSLSITEELWTPIADPLKQREFETFFSNLGGSEEKELQWEKLQHQVISHKALGPYWQFLALQEGWAKIYPPSTSTVSTRKPI
jgi:hypothetical protein